MTVDTSRAAVERLVKWHDVRAEVVPPHREGHALHMRTAATLRALLARAEAAEVRIDAAEAALVWQPIETAPRDGTRVLLIDGSDHYAGKWEDGSWTADCGQPVVYSPGPTHWRPLPPPPTTEAPA